MEKSPNVHILILVLLCLVGVGHSLEDWLIGVKDFFAGQGKNMPEFQCVVHSQWGEGGCSAYYTSHGQVCQLYSYDKSAGTSQCMSCVARFKEKTGFSDIPTNCISTSIEKTHFTEDEAKDIAIENKESIDNYMEKDNSSGLEIYSGDMGLRTIHVEIEQATCENGKSVGYVERLSGTVVVLRNGRVFNAVFGTELYPEDMVIIEEKSSLRLSMSGLENYYAKQKTKLVFQKCTPKTKGAIESFFSGIVDGIRKVFSVGISFVAETPTATAGVRG